MSRKVHALRFEVGRDGLKMRALSKNPRGTTFTLRGSEAVSVPLNRETRHKVLLAEIDRLLAVTDAA